MSVVKKRKPPTDKDKEHREKDFDYNLRRTEGQKV